MRSADEETRSPTAAPRPPATSRSTCSQMDDSETLGSSLHYSSPKVSHVDIQQKCGHSSFTTKLFNSVDGGSIKVRAAWTIGSLVVISLIFVLAIFVKPSSLDKTSNDFISTKPILTNGQPTNGTQKWLGDFSHSIKPRKCHSHNDYLRPYPLFSALAVGCSSVEADVWLTEDGTDLLVGHDKASLTADRTLTSLYLEPLLSILDGINAGSKGTDGAETTQTRGIFRTEPDATLVLLIDVKTQSSDTWPLVVKQLSPLRDKQYLTHYEDGDLNSGPITIVGTGNIGSDYSVFSSLDVDPTRPFDEYHDSFLDAPLASLPQPTNTVGNVKAVSKTPDESEQIWTNKTAYYASASFKATIGSVITGFSPSQLSILRTQIANAARLGLKSRYWDTPDWPVGYRDYVWGVLEREGVGVLNVDDLEAAARGDWDAVGRAWVREVVWMIAIGVWVVCCGVAVVVLGWKRRWVATTKRVEDSS